MTAPLAPATKFCHACGNKIDIGANMCRYCGAMQPTSTALAKAGTSELRVLPAFLLCFLLGFVGAHRFYAGKKGTAVLQIVTLGGLGIWWLVDLIMILTGSFRDWSGEKITEWV